MLSSLHEYLARQIDDNILNQLCQLKNRSDTIIAQLADEIRSLNSARLRFCVADHKYDQYELNAFF